MGLVNKVPPPAELEKEVIAGCREILEKAPYTLAYIEASFNADTDHVNGTGVMAEHALDLYYRIDESHEGAQAFVEKRPPQFSKFRK